ncbi:hypothetical protein [Oryzomonas rubra]|uniref:Uncharacterized protein n=1 Tax=Oryzomonas rubra TaxID=2509454 RepID=A0A5A9X8H6_9BACT|nr:hypothetical protein [Oryzomonas rubra]KAA0888788.1 hypothetical protein ET418_15520 [Oryzomonas rubra]
MKTIKQYWKEIAIGILIVVVCFISWRWTVAKAQVTTIQATQSRQNTISTVTAANGEVQQREAVEYPKLDKTIADNNSQRKQIKKQEAAIKVPIKEDMQNEIEKQTQGDSQRLADMFRADGYPCSVVTR